MTNIARFSTRLTLESGNRMTDPRHAHLKSDLRRSSFATPIPARPVTKIVVT